MADQTIENETKLAQLVDKFENDIYAIVQHLDASGGHGDFDAAQMFQYLRILEYRLINTFEKYFVDSMAKQAPKRVPPRPQTQEHHTSPVSAASAEPTLPRSRLVDPRLDPSRCVQARATLPAPIAIDAGENNARLRFKRISAELLSDIGAKQVADVQRTPSTAADKENPLKRSRHSFITRPPNVAVPAKQGTLAEQPIPGHGAAVVRPLPLHERRKSSNDANRIKATATGTAINARQLYRCSGAGCQMAFASVIQFREHIKQQHFLRNSEQYKCPYCSKQFVWAVHSVDSLISHLHVTHWNIM